MARNTGWDRRRVLGTGVAAVAGLTAAAFPGLGFADSGKDSGRDAPAVRVLRWLDGVRIPKLRDLRPGWLEPCPSLVRRICPESLRDLVDFAPVTTWSMPGQLDVRLLGFDGVSPVGHHGLDLWYPADGATQLLPYRLAEVRSNRLQGAPSTARAWAWDGRLVLQVSHGAGKAMAGAPTLVDVPAVPGLYLVTVQPAGQLLDPAAWAFAEARGGPFHRRLVDLYRQPPTGFGYFALSLSAV